MHLQRRIHSRRDREEQAGRSAVDLREFGNGDTSRRIAERSDQRRIARTVVVPGRENDQRRFLLASLRQQRHQAVVAGPYGSLVRVIGDQVVAAPEADVQDVQARFRRQRRAEPPQLLLFGRPRRRPVGDREHGQPRAGCHPAHADILELARRGSRLRRDHARDRGAVTDNEPALRRVVAVEVHLRDPFPVERPVPEIDPAVDDSDAYPVPRQHVRAIPVPHPVVGALHPHRLVGPVERCRTSRPRC